MSGHGAPPSPRALLQGMAALGALITTFGGLRAMGAIDRPGTLFSLGFLIVAGSVAGNLAAFARLPRLTGYLLAGLLAGPQGFALFSPHEVKALSLINALALALIAVQAGAEMTLPMLRRTARSAGISAAAQMLLVIPVMAGAFFLLRAHIPFAAGLDAPVVLALAAVWGVVSMTRSPAVTLAVIGETRSKGPLTDFALGNVVLLDVAVLPLFAIAMAIGRGQMLSEPFQASELVHLGYELFASVAAGVSFGLLLALLLRTVARERVLVLVVMAYAGTALCTYLRYDTLLVFVGAGFLVSNLTRQGEPLIHTGERLSAAVMIVFFATAGAKLDLDALRALWPIALTMFVLRAVITFISVRIGSQLARDPEAVKKNGWLSLVSQAGVTIGLATIVGEALPGVGPQLASLMIAVVGLNELFGAVAFKLGLSRAGEIPDVAATTEADDSPPQPASH